MSMFEMVMDWNAHTIMPGSVLVTWKWDGSDLGFIDLVHSWVDEFSDDNLFTLNEKDANELFEFFEPDLEEIGRDNAWRMTLPTLSGL
jgi:hypothetical protein